MLAIKKRRRLGVGLYSLADVARLTGASAASVARWVGKDGLVPRYLPEEEGTLTFVELMEVAFIKMFRDEGVSLQTIRRASQAAAKKFDVDYPFSVQRFDTDGKTIFATLIAASEGQQVLEDLERGQYCFLNVLQPFFRKLEYGQDFEVERYWPLDRGGRIVLDPERKFGQPIDAESGVTTRALFEAFTAGKGQDMRQVAEFFDVPVAAVEAAVKFERTLTA